MTQHDRILAQMNSSVDAAREAVAKTEALLKLMEGHPERGSVEALYFSVRATLKLAEEARRIHLAEGAPKAARMP